MLSQLNWPWHNTLHASKHSYATNQDKKLSSGVWWNVLKCACVNNAAIFLFTLTRFGAGRNVFMLKILGTLAAYPMTMVFMRPLYAANHFTSK